MRERKNKVVTIFWSTERGQEDRIKDNKPILGEWVVAYGLDDWIDTFCTKKEAVEYCAKNKIDFCFNDGLL